VSAVAAWDRGIVSASSDADLWERVSAGDADAFGRLYDRHASAIYNFLHRRTASWSDAEDLTSVVFLQAWRRRSEVVLDRDSALPWLLRTADYTARNEWRSKQRYRRALAAAHLLPSEIDDHAEEVVGRIADDQRIRAARESLKRLPRHEREVIELCVWGGLDQPAAAVALDVPIGTVKSRLSRARRHLRELNLPSVLETRP
jgi:RNA polymerase sigma factor (sigma-70 family)